MTVLSNSGENARPYNLTIGGTDFTDGQVITELITCTNITVGDTGDITIPMVSGLPSVLYPALKLVEDGHPC